MRVKAARWWCSAGWPAVRGGSRGVLRGGQHAGQGVGQGDQAQPTVDTKQDIVYVFAIRTAGTGI